MGKESSQADVVQAARDLGKSEFTRDDIATKLGVKRVGIKEGFKSAKNAGELEKVRRDEDGTSYFRLAG